MKILRGVGGLADLDVVARGELEKPFDARAGMFGALALVSMGKKHHHSGQQTPLIFARGDELIDDDLRAIGEITELRFPEHESLREIAAEAVFEAENGGLGKGRIIDFEPALIGRHVFERDVFFFSFGVDESGVALVERAAAAILPGEAHGHSLQKEGAEGQRFGHSEIDGALAVGHFDALFE